MMQHSLNEYLDQHPKRSLIFDFDETLFTLDLPWEIYVQEMQKRLEVLAGAPLAGNLADEGIMEYENQVIRTLGEAAAKVRSNYAEEFERVYLRGVTEHYELTDFIREHATQYSFYLWTSNMRSTVEPPLEKSGLLQYFSRLVTKSDVLLVKPEPEGFSQIYSKAAGHVLSEFLLIGNSSHDEQAAEAAGIDFFLVSHGE